MNKVYYTQNNTSSTKRTLEYKVPFLDTEPEEKGLGRGMREKEK